MSLNLDFLKSSVEQITRISGVEGFVVSSTDGLPLLSSMTDKDLEEKVSALTAVLSEVGNRASLELRGADADVITVNAPDGSGIIYTKLGEIGYLAVLFNKDARLGVILYTLRDIKNRLKGS
ncbi:MAG: roadblock/LC7 domain-containing protein [Infirmifilum sp.]